MTQWRFMAEYRGLLISTCPWAQDETKLDRFMSTVRSSIETDVNLWCISGKPKCVTLAWRAIGGKGKPTYTALRALPRV